MGCFHTTTLQGGKNPHCKFRLNCNECCLFFLLLWRQNSGWPQVREKNLQGQEKVKDSYFESRKLDIFFKKSEGKLKEFNTGCFSTIESCWRKHSGSLWSPRWWKRISLIERVERTTMRWGQELLLDLIFYNYLVREISAYQGKVREFWKAMSVTTIKFLSFSWTDRVSH